MAEDVRGPTVLDDSRSEPSQLDQTEYQSTGVYNTFEDMLRAQGNCVTASFFLRTLFCDALGLPSGAYIEGPRPLGWTQVVDCYRQLFRTSNVRVQDVVLRLQGRRLYIGPHVQEFPVHLDLVWDERLARWCIDLRGALSGRRALPRFPVVEPAPQEVGSLELSSNPVGEDPRDQGRTTRGSTGGSQAAGEERDAQLKPRSTGLPWRD